MSSAFVKRKIDVIFNMGEGAKGEKPGEDIRISGLRVAAHVEYVAASVQAQAQLKIFGLKESLMNYLTGTGFAAAEVRNNRVTVLAGDEGGVMSTVYKGTIWRSYADYSGAPEVSLNVHCLGSYYDTVKPYSSRSYKGAVDVASILSEIAQDIDLAFENDGVDVKLTDQHLKGTAMDQINQCVQAANIAYTISCGKLIIFPQGKSRNAPVIRVSPQTGMVGYPAISSQDLTIMSLYSPLFEVGRRVQIESDMMVANGQWVISAITHSLESEVPKGPWFSAIQCMRPIGE